MANSKGGLITLEEIIKGYLRDTWETNTALYQRAMSWAMDCVNELRFDVLRDLKRKFIAIDPSTQTAKIPNDFVQYTRVGLVTVNNEFVPLVYNPAIITTSEIPDCDEIDEHCDCGCDSETCYAFGDSNVVTTFSDVVLNGTTYQDSVTICVNSDGSVIQRTCNHLVTNPTKQCTYQRIFARQSSEIVNIPWTNAYFTKNGLQSFIGVINDSSDLITVMTGNGFTLTSQNVSTITFTINNSADVWESITYTDSNGAVQTLDFVQSSCVTPTPQVSEYCYETKLCDVTVKPCGCVVPTDTAINILNRCCFFACAVTSRQRNAKDFGQTFAQPKGYFGEFNIDVSAGIMKFNFDYQYNTVFLEYYSADKIDSKNFLLPIQTKETVIAYIYWKSLQKKRGVTQWEKSDARHEYYNEKRKLKQRLHPLNLDELMQVVRVYPRP